VEFALVLPFLAVLALGTVDLGRAFQLKNRLTNAAREGAVFGQFRPCETAAIQTAVDDEDPNLASLNGYSRTVTVSGCPSSATGNLTVTASAKMTILTPFVSAITGKNVTVSGKSTVAVQ
jgi:Flp pilus assembly protein TadG